ncbi:MAG: WYL domain-containing protein [Deltaproteobacteria bacterium]|nr:WYL domain-containing protein [Deltaproteobacteria bacterium]
MQETVETGADGSLTLRFLACSDEEVVMCLKPWLPHVRVVKPGYIGDLLVQEFRQWIAWQGSGVM